MDDKQETGAVVVRESDGRLELVYRWHHSYHLQMALASFVWIAFLLWAAYDKATSGEGSVPDAILGAALGSLVGGYLFYIALAGLLNKTTVVVDKDRLSVSHAPLPWRRAQTFPVSHLKQLYVQRKSPPWWNQRTIPTFSLCALLATGTRVKLIEGRAQDTDLLFLEKTLESHLAIQDQAMPEEYD